MVEQVIKVWKDKSAYEEGEEPFIEQEVYRSSIIQVEGNGGEMVLEAEYEEDERAASFDMKVIEIEPDFRDMTSERWNRLFQKKYQRIEKSDNPEFDRTEKVLLHKRDHMVVDDVVVLRLDNFSLFKNNKTKRRANITKMSASLKE